MTEAESSRLNGSTVLAIVAMSLCIFVVANDFVAMSVALPRMEEELNSDVSLLQWVINAYAVVVGVMIVPGGRLADMYGRLRILYLGTAIFALFSLVGGLAPDVYSLIVARGLQGVGGALMWPAILGLIYQILPAAKAGLAGGLVIGVAGIGNATGPLLGGALTELASWRWILLINVPIAAIAMFVTWRCVKVEAPSDREKIDYWGTLLLAVTLFSLLIALTDAPDLGWSNPQVWGLLLVSAVAMVLFVLRERQAGDGALIPGSVMKRRPFLVACLAVLAMSTTFFGALLYLPQYFEKIFDLNPLAAGAALLPFMAVFAVASFAQSWLIGRIGIKAVISLGAVCMFLGPTLLALVIQPESSYVAFLPGMIVLGIGVGLFYSAVTTAALTSLEPSMSSLAGGLVYLFQIAGGAVGLGITTTIFLAAANAGISDGAQQIGITLNGSEIEAIRGVIVGTDISTDVAQKYSGSTGEQLVEVVRVAFADGVKLAFGFNAAMAFIGMLIALFTVAGPINRIGRDVGELELTTAEESDSPE